MIKKFFENRKNKNLCKDCSICCDYITVEIDEPETVDDFDEIIWFINHKNVIVYLDNEDCWNVEFQTPCMHTTEKGLCGVYDDRPDVCRFYTQDECLKCGEGDIFKILFKTKQDVVDYVKNNTDIKDLR